jgi:hypothetical protein
MTRTVIGLFDGVSEAQRVIHTCLAHGVPREAMRLVANREETSIGDALAAGAWGVDVEVGPASRGQPAALIELGVPPGAAPQYAEGMRHGGALVSITATEPQVDVVCELMERATASAIASGPLVPRRLLALASAPHD